MIQLSSPTPRVAIACGGTGGHLFPGIAVAEQLLRHGCAVTLLISPKEIDQQAVKSAKGMDIATLPAIGLTRGGQLGFARGFTQSCRAVWKLFRKTPPEAVLAMGGFTSAPPIIVGKTFQAATFLHESNTIPGKANRWLSWIVDEAFVGFEETAPRLHTRKVRQTGTPVREEFSSSDKTAASRQALGLHPEKPVLLVTGGSQGASGLNEVVLQSLPQLVKLIPGVQLLHLTGPNDSEKVQRACEANGVRAVVRPFMAEMHLALSAATVAISRAGASSLAELAAVRVPAVLVPFPAATDNHQHFNARAFEKSGAARLLAQTDARPETLASSVAEIVSQSTHRQMRDALGRWHFARAAEDIAGSLVRAIESRRQATGRLRLQSKSAVERRESIST